MGSTALLFCVLTTAQVRYWIDTDLPGHSRQDVATVTAQAAALWMQVAGVTIQPAASPADANLRVQGGSGWWLGLTDIGGPNYYRRGGVSRLRINTARQFTRQSLLSLIGHEMGHAIGLPHGPGIMAPRTTGLTQLGASDVAGAVRLYGPPRAVAVQLAYAPLSVPVPAAIAVVTVDRWPTAPTPELWPEAPSRDRWPAAPPAAASEPRTPPMPLRFPAPPPPEIKRG